MKDPKFARFHLLPKIHKRLHNVPGRPVISNNGYNTENISSFLDHHLQLLAQVIKSYIKDTNEFLKKLRSLPKLPDSIISKHTAWEGSVCIKKTTGKPKRKICLNWHHYRVSRSSVKK